MTEMWRLVPEWVEGIPAWIYWSLGILIRACITGLISRTEAEQHIIQLYEVSSLYVTRTIVELAVRQLYEQTRK